MVTLDSYQGSLTLRIRSDFAGDHRKSKLFVNRNVQSERLESFKQRVKTKKANRFYLNFIPEDHYDSEVDVYEVPSFSIEKGCRKAKVSTNSHGSTPKDWVVGLAVQMTPTKSITPILEIVKLAVGRFLNEDHIKSMTKDLRKVLQGKSTHEFFYLPESN